MLTNRPTVALTSDMPIWLVVRSPTRAREPRTEITRPKDVTVVAPQIGPVPHYEGAGWTNG